MAHGGMSRHKERKGGWGGEKARERAWPPETGHVTSTKGVLELGELVLVVDEQRPTLAFTCERIKRGVTVRAEGGRQEGRGACRSLRMLGGGVLQ